MVKYTFVKNNQPLHHIYNSDITLISYIKVNETNFDILGWAFSWTSSLSPRPPGGIPASEAAQGEYKRNAKMFFSLNNILQCCLKLWDNIGSCQLLLNSVTH